MPLINKFTALSHGLETNSNGGTYRNGAAYPLEKKLEAQEQIFEDISEAKNGIINQSEVAQSPEHSLGLCHRH